MISVARLHRRVAVAACAVGLFTLVSPLVHTQIGRGGTIRMQTRIDDRPAVEGEVLVRYRDQVSALGRADAEVRAEAEETEAVGSQGVRRLRSRRKGTAELLEFLNNHPDVEYAEPNWIVYALAQPNDPSFGNLWGLLNTGQTISGQSGTAGVDIDATTAWDVTTGTATLVVGVIDSGVDYNHPDLAANMWSAPAPFSVTIGGQSISCAAGTHGFNAITKTCDPMDDNNHGTHASGTIGAVGNNGAGLTGVNWTTRIMGLKFLGANGSGSTADAINAIEFAIQAKAAFAGGGTADVRVLSNSWGGGGFSQALLDEITKANTNAMLFVAAAGNNATNNDATPNYPSNYTAPNVVAVAATDNRDQLASFSNYGATTVDLAAPGVNIYSTVRSGGYSYMSGTSMATPHVAGAAMLMLAECPMTTATLRTAVLGAIDSVAGLAPVTATGGRLNVARGLSQCTPKVSSVTIAPGVNSPQAAGTAITWTATPSGGTPPYQYKWLTSANGTTWSTAQTWSTSNSFVWTPGRPGSTYKVGVWVRSAPATADTFEAGTVATYTITGATSVSLSANKSAPQAPGTTVTWTATPAGGTAPYAYKWLVSTNGTSWSTAADWSASSTYAWTPMGSTNANHKVGVWVRSAGNSVNDYETGTVAGFSVVGTSSVALAADKVAPQAPGTTITWTATPTGGVGPHEYKWLVKSTGAWSVVQGWSTSNSFAWTPATASGSWQVGVWVRSAGNTADTYEAGTVTPFAITSTVSAVSLGADKSAPQSPGTTITFTATPTGGVAPRQYKWLLSSNGTSWSVVQNWSTSNTYAWTPTGGSNPSYKVGVWVRSAGNTADTYEAGTVMAFAITANTVASVGLSANTSAPQSSGSTITWTATPSGGTGPHQYKWLVSANGTSWSVAQAWSTSSTFAWTPSGGANPNYKVGVWVKSAGNAADTYEAGNVAAFAIVAGVSSVSIAADKAAPQTSGTTITWTATASGGTGPLQYKWLVSANGTSWSVAQAWSTSNTFAWTPSGGANPSYKVGLWVKSAGNAADTYEAGAVQAFAIQ